MPRDLSEQLAHAAPVPTKPIDLAWIEQRACRLTKSRVLLMTSISLLVVGLGGMTASGWISLSNDGGPPAAAPGTAAPDETERVPPETPDITPRGEVLIVAEGEFGPDWGVYRDEPWQLRVWRAGVGECYQLAIGQALDEGVACTGPGTGDVGGGDGLSLSYEPGGQSAHEDLAVVVGVVPGEASSAVAVDPDGERFALKVVRPKIDGFQFAYYVAFIPTSAYLEIEAYGPKGELVGSRRFDVS